MTSFQRLFSVASTVRHENPLGLPKSAGPTIPRRAGPVQKRRLPHVKKVLAVASGKGGVGKSTIAVNLAFALALHPRRPRVGVLDIDVFGPSIPKLMGLEDADEPRLTSSGAIIPIVNHGLPCMSMGFLLPPTPLPPPAAGGAAARPSNADTPVVWRGLMVQKAVQQLLFDVDWRETGGTGAGEAADAGAGLDVLVVDLPPGTGDVPLTLGQLVHLDGAVIASTPQDVSLADVRKGVAMFRKLSIPITGIILNTSYFICPSCSTPHYLFGAPDSFRKTAGHLGIKILGELPLVPQVSRGGDEGIPYMLSKGEGPEDNAGREWREVMNGAAARVWDALEMNT